MVKKYSIVEFGDGVQLIPSCWMNADRSQSAWPGSIKNFYKLNKLIIQGDPPPVNDDHQQWVICDIIKWFGSADTYKRAVELRDNAMDTSTILDSDVMDERAQRKERIERRRNNRDVEMATGEPPLKKKKKKKSKTCDVPEVYSENAPACSSTPLRTTKNRSTNLNHFPILPVIEDTNSIQIAPDPVRHQLTASSNQPNIESTATFDFQEFMVGHAKKTSEGIRDLSKRLQRIEEQISTRTDYIDNCDRFFDEFPFFLPVKTEEDLYNLDLKLQDPSALNNMIHFLKKIGGSNVPITTGTVMTKLIDNSVAENYSWHGKKLKKPFTNFSNIVKLILRSVHAICSDSEYRCTDANIILGASKWLAQTKTRIVRAEVRINKGLYHVHLNQLNYTEENQGSYPNQFLQQPSPGNTVQPPSLGDALQLPSPANELI